ncbi:DUF6468 domain-containing protein [Rhodovibrionaceae bacterium A322]
MSWTLLIDGILAALLLITIAYATVLNGKLTALRSAKDEMEAMIKEFAAAADQADHGVSELKQRALASGSELENQVKQANEQLEKARVLTDELSFLVEKGESLAGRMDQGISDSRGSDSGPKKKRASGKGLSKLRGRKALQSEEEAAEGDAKSALLKSLEALR